MRAKVISQSLPITYALLEEEAHEEVEEEAPKDETEIQVVCSFAVTDHQSTSFRFRLHVLLSNQVISTPLVNL
ncbi:hypothetical protein C1H46_030509 [Malus baccata]|uniref:Uncharacterized protein n=1 Tax=Malus baccata TaxID=106549 RepID=A0A540LBX0_MALBA|nr:hypothetical protein C1H46_030509 [Malus baccata]